MNKDKIGLIKYVSILVVEMFLPLICLGMFFLGLGLSESNLIIPNFIAIIGAIIFFITPIIYFILPVVVTTKAIKNHWSSYLDRFFNQLKLPTLVLLFGIPLLIFGYRYERTGSYDTISLYLGYFQLVLVSLIPPSCLIYLVILIHNIRKKYPNQCKKITDFINKYRGMHNG